MTLDRVVSETAAEGSNLPIFVTEFGIASDNGAVLSSNYGWDLDMTYTEAAAGMSGTLDRWTIDYPRLEHAYWYQTKDQSDPGVTSNSEHYFGLLQNDLDPKGGIYTTFTSYVANGGA